MDSIIVNHLSKAYKQYPHRWSRLAEWLLPGRGPRHTLKWVLQDVSFAVSPGEAVGIIGLNGAGKSTLLKIVTGTTQPTTGFVRMSGRIAAMLELGMGFHPDFTGRQNVYMAAQLLGHSIEEIDALMPKIEEFAEIGEYINQPVRVYSSGMQMRLAFSVATARRPDILIIDEALSVGDAYFQHKSFDRIREFGKQGTTLLIVSHDKQAIQSICDRAILLGAGKLIMEGEPEAVTDYYNAMLAMDQPQNLIQTSTTIAGGYQNTESGTSEAVIESVILKNTHGDTLTTVNVGQAIEVHVQVFVKNDISSLVLGCGFKDRYGQMIFGTNTYHTNQELKNCRKGDRVVFVVSCMANLGVGSYSINVAIHANETHLLGNYHWIDRAFVFEVVNMDKYQFVGNSWNEMIFSVNLNGVMINKREQSWRSRDLSGIPGIVVAKTHYGKMLVYAEDMVIGNSLLKTGAFQEEKIREVLEFLNGKFSFFPKIFIDIGANIGTHLIYALQSGLFDRAIGFEPEQRNFNLLQANLAINGLSERSEVFQMALSNKSRIIDMELSNYNYGDHRICPQAPASVSFGEETERKMVCVQSTTLDNFFSENPYDLANSLVWMDTQGHEGLIFDGARKSLSKNGPFYIVTEFWPYGIERSGGKYCYFSFLEKCQAIFDLNSPKWSSGTEVHVHELRIMYDDMLSKTEKEIHPHTDLLLRIDDVNE